MEIILDLIIFTIVAVIAILIVILTHPDSYTNEQ